jgi:hypothetical protein
MFTYSQLKEASDPMLMQGIMERLEHYRTSKSELGVEFLFEAQFIMHELETRQAAEAEKRSAQLEERNAKLETRSFVLEVAIVILIVFELIVGIAGLMDHSTVRAIEHLESTIQQSNRPSPKAP